MTRGLFLFSHILFISREKNCNNCSLLRLALQLYLRVMQRGGVLNDGQPQACAADSTTMAFIHTVKPLKDPALVVIGLSLIHI